MAKKRNTPNYATTAMTVNETVSYVTTPDPITLPTHGPKTCESCGQFHIREDSYGECRLNPPSCMTDHLTRQGPVRRYPVVLSNTPACSFHRPKAA